MEQIGQEQSEYLKLNLYEQNNLNDTSGTFIARGTSGFGKIYDNETLDRDELDYTIDVNKENDKS